MYIVIKVKANVPSLLFQYNFYEMFDDFLILIMGIVGIKKEITY